MKYFLVAILPLLFIQSTLLPPQSSKLSRRECHKMEPLGESGCMALLGGLRAPVAVWLWLKVEMCWEKKQWEEMDQLLEMILQLQPYCISYYTMAAWQLAWNASSAMNEVGQMRFYINRGRIILEKGIKKNPQSSLLYEYLGILLRDRLYDHEAAATAFGKAAILPGAPSHLRRFAVYELAASGNHDKEAYQQIRELYEEGEAERTPALMAWKERLEKKLSHWDQ